MEYRVKNGYDVYHWCKNCHLWPTKDYKSYDSPPPGIEQCNHCKGKENNNNCTTS